MNTAVSPTTRRSALGVALVGLFGCGGDANQQGAATDTGAAAAATAGAPTNVSPQEAVAFMAAANQSEVQAAQVAVNKATNAQVRQFAQKMQREHSESAREIGQLAAQMNVDVQSGGQQGQMVQRLQQMSQQMSQQLNATPKGPEFDRVYMDGQVQAHQAVLENLQRIAGGTGATAAGGATGTTPSQQPTGAPAATARPTTPQQAAQKMIPRVQQHLEEARQIQSRLASGNR